jgi:hypothetical protein
MFRAKDAGAIHAFGRSISDDLQERGGQGGLSSPPQAKWKQIDEFI